MSEPRRTATATLVKALRILSREIYCEDGVATAAIAEGADRIEELQLTRGEVSSLVRAADCMSRKAQQQVCHHVAGYLLEDAGIIRGIVNRMGGDT